MLNILEKTSVEYDIYKVHEIVRGVDMLFIPPLSSRVNLEEYIKKLDSHANILLATGSKRNIIGILAYYANNIQTNVGFITLLGILPKYQGGGVASRLLGKCIAGCIEANRIKVEVKTESTNVKAITFYKRNGFEIAEKLSESGIEKIKFIRGLAGASTR